MIWVSSFISNRTTITCLPSFNTDTFSTYTSIPQGLLPSPINFLFYNANIVEISNPPTLSASGTVFVDNVNPLAIGMSIDEFCKMLQKVPKRCLEWARRHEASLVLEWYILVYFTKARMKHNQSCPLILPAYTVFPKPLCMFSGHHTQLEPQLAASHQVQACHPDQCLHQAHSVNIGCLHTGFGAALYCCFMPSHHHWLPCLVGPSLTPIF